MRPSRSASSQNPADTITFTILPAPLPYLLEPALFELKSSSLSPLSERTEITTSPLPPSPFSVSTECSLRPFRMEIVYIDSEESDKHSSTDSYNETFTSFAEVEMNQIGEEEERNNNSNGFSALSEVSQRKTELMWARSEGEHKSPSLRASCQQSNYTTPLIIRTEYSPSPVHYVPVVPTRNTIMEELPSNESHSPIQAVTNINNITEAESLTNINIGTTTLPSKITSIQKVESGNHVERKLCKQFTLTGKCNYGARCLFHHSQTTDTHLSQCNQIQSNTTKLRKTPAVVSSASPSLTFSSAAVENKSVMPAQYSMYKIEDYNVNLTKNWKQISNNEIYRKECLPFHKNIDNDNNHNECKSKADRELLLQPNTILSSNNTSSCNTRFHFDQPYYWPRNAQKNVQQGVAVDCNNNTNKNVFNKINNEQKSAQVNVMEMEHTCYCNNHRKGSKVNNKGNNFVVKSHRYHDCNELFANRTNMSSKNKESINSLYYKHQYNNLPLPQETSQSPHLLQSPWHQSEHLTDVIS